MPPGCAGAANAATHGEPHRGAVPATWGRELPRDQPQSDVYNCIAWAAGATDKWWWPHGDPKSTHWPPGAPRAETVPAFQAAFATLGYVPCDSGELEPGFEKIALFAEAELVPTHAARQLANGAWTSKLGALEDIEHLLESLDGAAYGAVAVIMKRPSAVVGAGG